MYVLIRHEHDDNNKYYLAVGIHGINNKNKIQRCKVKSRDDWREATRCSIHRTRMSMFRICK